MILPAASDGAQDAAPSPVLVATNVWKRYGGTQALAGVDISLDRGEIHALLGGNGSGKSTLIKILSGVEHADRGEIRLGGGETMPASASRRADRLSVVHQQESTFQSLTVAENLSAAAFQVPAVARIRWSALYRHAQDILDRFEIDARPDQVLGELGPAKQKMVAIARALSRQPEESSGVVILDEPTAALPAPEAGLLLDALRRYASTGWSILYVSHRLRELPGFAGRATILQDGRVAETLSGADVNLNRLMSAVAGGVLDAAPHTRLAAIAPQASDGLVLRGVSGGRIHDVSFAVRPGELVGLVGLVGSGRSSLLRMIFGSQDSDRGVIELDGRPVRRSRPAEDAEVALIPEDRAKEAAFSLMTVNENLSAGSVGRFWRRGLFRHRWERQESNELTRQFSIKTASVDAPLISLSGGNQQKVILARWLRRSPRVLLLDEPTQGVDVRSRAEIHQLVRDAASAGAAVLVASSDFEEIATQCDRALILVDGRLVANVEGTELTPARLAGLSQGVRSLATGRC